MDIIEKLPGHQHRVEPRTLYTYIGRKHRGAIASFIFADFTVYRCWTEAACVLPTPKQTKIKVCSDSAAQGIDDLKIAISHVATTLPGHESADKSIKRNPTRANSKRKEKL